MVYYVCLHNVGIMLTVFYIICSTLSRYISADFPDCPCIIEVYNGCVCACSTLHVSSSEKLHICPLPCKKEQQNGHGWAETVVGRLCIVL